jgi:hypothetical protein
MRRWTRRPSKETTLDAYQFDKLVDRLDQIIQGQKELKGAIVTAVDDLTAAVQAMRAEWTTFLADLTNALNQPDQTAAIQAATALVQQQTADMQTEDAAVNPPAAPAAAASVDSGSDVAVPDSSGDTPAA